MQSTPNFTHLHVHTEYSLLDGSNKIKEYISRVKELGMNSAAITDHGAMYGVIEFYKEAKAAGIKPIIGCEVYVAPSSRFDREVSGGEERYHHLVLLAENNQGYANLMKIVSIGYVEGFYYRPRVDKEVLRKYSAGLIALSACLAGEVQRLITRGLVEEAKKAALAYRDIFGADHYFLEMQDHGISEQRLVNQTLLSMSEELEIALVVTNDVHYTYADDVYPHDILLCIQTAKKLADEDRMRYEGGQYFVKSPSEMAALFPYAEKALENTQMIADRCEVEIEFGVTKLPEYDVPEGFTATEYLKKLCQAGLAKRYGDAASQHQARLAFELDTIIDMGFVDYFLIVWDFIKYAKDNGISVGPGRGSAAGSIVAYCLEITDIDPIHYQLLFERFLNPERVSLPDIDIDFCYERRQEVIDYVVGKYGSDRVVQIITFGTMAARGVIRDVGRVMDLPYAFVDGIAKMIPTELSITIDKAMHSNQDLRIAYENDERVKDLIDNAKRLEGLPRHSSMHAAGVVISKLAASEYVPLSKAADGSITTEFTMNTLEELGLLKMDFLGLRTLTVIENAVQLIRKKQPDLDINQIDYQDSKVLEYIGTGQTDGIFQVESAGMKNFMKELKPHVLEDLIAGIALYRPGPMDFIPQYIKGKNQAATVTYDCPALKTILEPTYGCIVYQEQVMQIVRDLAGYTLGRSDILRRAMSKKKGDVMEKERQVFVYGDVEHNVPGCVNNGISETVANKIYDEMIDFAKYAFNKSHAAAYGVVSYQTAWLKYYFPVEFMAALLTSVIDHNSKVAEYIYACRQMKINILPPDINGGYAAFTVFQDEIRYGLSAIKGLGQGVIVGIVAEREASGLFKSLEDFITRMMSKEALNKRAIENLIKAGAFDNLEGTRKQLVEIYGKIVDKLGKDKKHSMSGQMSLFDIVSEAEKEAFEIKLPDIGEFDKSTRLAQEKDVLGVYVSGHPLDEDEEHWRRTISVTSLDFLAPEEEEERKIYDGAKVIIGGMIVDLTTKFTKTNQQMAFITVEDLLGTVEVVIFPRDYESNRQYLQVDSKIFVRGRVSEEDDRPAKLICEKISPFMVIKKELWIQFSDKDAFSESEQNVYTELADFEGDDEVVIYLRAEHATKRLSRNRNIRISPEILARLRNRFGEQMVKVVEKPVEIRL
ncbi:MAG: DNA polymerase III subunit alpha [Lachnospiraceae bacterium]|nr:DNA polymerase III subunit alpha [Lachnospiraceae bacterium]